MKPSVFGLSLVLYALIAAPSAAQPPFAPRASGGKQAQAPPNEPAHKIFVLTGCLTGSPAGSAFKLTGAVSVGQAPPERSAASPDAKDVYELLPTSGLTEQGIAQAELQTHVGRKVEVTVRPVEVSPGPSSSSSRPTSTAKIEEAPPQRYTVTKIKSVSDACR